MIGRARVELAWSALTGDLAEAAHWATSNRQIREILLADLAEWDADELELEEAERLVGWVVQLAVTSEDKRQARDKLLELMIYETGDFMFEEMMSGVLQLAPTTEDKRQARDKLLELLADQTEGSTQGWVVAQLVDALVRLGPTADDNRQARDRLLELLASQTEGWVVAELADALIGLGPTVEERRQAREKLLMIYETGDFMSDEMMSGVLQLPPRRRTSGRPATSCWSCWPARAKAGQLLSWRIRWSGSIRPRRTSGRRATSCWSCWPARAKAGQLLSWRIRWSGSIRPRRTSGKRATGC